MSRSPVDGYEESHAKAQDILWSLAGRDDGEDPDVQERLAGAALEACRDLADAYVALGNVAERRDGDLERARELYENGVAAGEREIRRLRGPKTFTEDRGEFHGIVETRGYVRARGCLAVVLYALGDKEEAERHARDLLRLNEADNLGLRYDLARWLHEQGRREDLEKHLRKYHAFSRDPWKQDAGFEDEVPEVLPDRYWRLRRG